MTQSKNIADNSNPVLIARQLTKSFGSTVAVDKVDLELHPGRCLTLLGPNGAGKTTVVEMLEGLKSPDHGEIVVFGTALTNQHRRTILEDLGVVMQETNLYKKMTVAETLTLFASFYQQPASVTSILEKFNLMDVKDKRLEHLSGGQKQRVYLGCALINKPKILFLDEPTTGLDPEARRDIWLLINELKADGCAILLTTHYMEEAEYLADHVLVMHRGRILFHGLTTELLESQSKQAGVEVKLRCDEKTADLIAKKNLGPLINLGFDNYQLDITQAQTTETLKDLLALGVDIQSMQTHRPKLEDVYLDLTRNAEA